MRNAEEIALPAFVASRVAARPVAKRVFAMMETEGLAPNGLLLAEYDARTDAAVDSMLQSLASTPVLVDVVRSDLRRAVEAAESWWLLAESGEVPISSNLVGADTDDENNVHEMKSLHTAFTIQARITKNLDRLKVQALRERMEALGHEEDLRRMNDLQDAANQEHTWWQSLNPQTDRVLPPAELVTAMLIRLGAEVLPTDRICGSCGVKMLDSCGYHALCCGRAESTIGHDRVRDCVGMVCAYSDPATELEALGLCPQELTLRPADVLTRALHPTQIVAADVGVRAPHAASAGTDPLGNMRADKLEKYEPHRDDLAAQGVIYEPLIFSCYGRRHPRTTDMLKLAASRAARCRGSSKSGGLLRWWHRQLAAEIWRRAAKMVHSCTPRWVPPEPSDADEAEDVEMMELEL